MLRDSIRDAYEAVFDPDFSGGLGAQLPISSSDLYSHKFAFHVHASDDDMLHKAIRMLYNSEVCYADGPWIDMHAGAVLARAIEGMPPWSRVVIDEETNTPIWHSALDPYYQGTACGADSIENKASSLLVFEDLPCVARVPCLFNYCSLQNGRFYSSFHYRKEFRLRASACTPKECSQLFELVAAGTVRISIRAYEMRILPDTLLEPDDKYGVRLAELGLRTQKLQGVRLRFGDHHLIVVINTNNSPITMISLRLRCEDTEYADDDNLGVANTLPCIVRVCLQGRDEDFNTVTLADCNETELIHTRSCSSTERCSSTATLHASADAMVNCDQCFHDTFVQACVWRYNALIVSVWCDSKISGLLSCTTVSSYSDESW